jgi:hypothetical protein
MTDPSAAKQGAKQRQAPQTDLPKLLALVGASGLVYAGALGPVLTSVRGVQAADASRAALAKRAMALARQNRQGAARLETEEQRLEADLQREQELRSEIAALKSETPPPAASSPQIASVNLPAVHTTTGASGVP